MHSKRIWDPFLLPTRLNNNLNTLIIGTILGTPWINAFNEKTMFIKDLDLVLATCWPDTYCLSECSSKSFFFDGLQFNKMKSFIL